MRLPPQFNIAACDDFASSSPQSSGIIMRECMSVGAQARVCVCVSVAAEQIES